MTKLLTCCLSTEAGRHKLGGPVALLLEQALPLLLCAPLNLRLTLALLGRNLVQLAQALLLLLALLLVLCTRNATKPVLMGDDAI
jgi:hypothetical protein